MTEELTEIGRAIEDPNCLEPCEEERRRFVADWRATHERLAAALRVKGQLVGALEAQERKDEMDRRGVGMYEPEYLRAVEEAKAKRAAAIKAAKETP